MRWCSVLQDRWILPHYAVRASFSMGRWSARVCLPTRFSVLWPAAWVACSDKSRSSKSVEVRRIWEVYDESCLQFVPLSVMVWTFVVGFVFYVAWMHLPAALHGVVVEASLVSISGLRKLRTAFGQAALSGGLRLANPGAVLSLLDGPVGSDPGFHGMLRRHMAYDSSVHELVRIYSLLRVVSAGAPGHGPGSFIAVQCLCVLGFLGTRIHVFSSGLVCLLFVRSLVLFSCFGRLFGMLGELRLLVTLILGLVFGVAGIWTLALL